MQKTRNDRDGKLIISYSPDGSYTSNARTVPDVLSDEDANNSYQHPITKNASKARRNYTTGKSLHPDWNAGADSNGADDGSA